MRTVKTSKFIKTLTQRYCPECKCLFDERESIQQDNHYFCAKCHHQLVYFGREKVSISSLSTLLAYDALHPYKPIHDYTGGYTNYSSYSPPISLIECEDMLKYDSTNKEALIFMSKYYWKLNNITQAIIYIEKHLRSNIPTPDDVKYYISLLLMNKQYNNILSFIKKHKKKLDIFYIAHHKAICFLGLGNIKKSLLYFYQSHSLCSNHKRKEKIKNIITQLNAYNPS